MATPQVKTVRKAAPAARSNPIRKTAGKPKAAPAVLKLATTKAAKERTATSAPKPASMTGPLPPIVTLKHLAEWAGYNHGVAKKQAIEMFTGFVADIGRVLEEGPQNPHSQPWRPASTNSTTTPGAQGAQPGHGRGDPDQSQ